jgi:glycosyltransferase involved in cell wall biosynthesis
MTRILLLIKGLDRGGAEQLLASTARHLDRSRFGYEVAYLLPDRSALVPELQRTGLRVRCLEGSRGAGWIGRLRSLVADRRIDVVHVHSPYVAVGARLGLPRGVRLVYTEHNVWESYRRPTYWGNLLTFGRNDHVFCVSERVRVSLRYPRPLRFLRSPPVETLYHGHDPAVLGPDGGAEEVRAELGIPPGAPVVGTVASFKRHKGHQYLIRAAERVRRAVPDVRFVLVGRGPLEERVRAQARALGLDGTLIFAGYREDAPRIAGAFDVFALSSVYEGLSIALVEAMAQGRPVVVTEVGGLPEVVEHGQHGLVVRAEDPDALGDAILTLLQDAGLRQRFGEAARRRAGDFDIRRAASRIEEVYGELVG